MKSRNPFLAGIASGLLSLSFCGGGDIALSNSMVIPRGRIERIEESEGTHIYHLNEGYGVDFDGRVFDKGDGRPFIKRYVEDGGVVTSGHGSIMSYGHFEECFDLTYQHKEKTYPVWEPLSEK